MDNKPVKIAYPCPCLRCGLGDEECARRGTWRICPSYRKWINWSWARFRGWPRRMEAEREKKEKERKKRDVWRYVEPYLLEENET